MSKPLLLTVVIPVYNRSIELDRALQSLCSQTLQNFEVIICDDGSDEDINVVADRYRKSLPLQVLRLQHSGGPAHPRNCGVRHAKTTWVSFLDSDDWWDCSRVEVIANSLNLDCDVYYHRLAVINTSQGSTSSRTGVVGFPPGRRGMLTTLLCKHNPIPLSSAVVRRQAIIDVGGFDPTTLEDYDLWIRLALVGAQFFYADQVLGSYSLAKDNISAFTPEQVRIQKNFFDKTLSRLSGHDLDAANSHFSYLLCSYALKINDPDWLSSLNGVSFVIDPLRWLKLRAKLFLWGAWRR